jgi:hypothetical protein
MHTKSHAIIQAVGRVFKPQSDLEFFSAIKILITVAPCADGPGVPDLELYNTSPSALIDHVSDTTEDNGGFSEYMLLRQQLIAEKSIAFNDCH